MRLDVTGHWGRAGRSRQCRDGCGEKEKRKEKEKTSTFDHDQPPEPSDGIAALVVPDGGQEGYSPKS